MSGRQNVKKSQLLYIFQYMMEENNLFVYRIFLKYIIWKNIICEWAKMYMFILRFPLLLILPFGQILLNILVLGIRNMCLSFCFETGLLCVTFAGLELAL